MNRSYSVSLEDHVITAGNAAYQFDADGFLTQKTIDGSITTYQYSSRGELLSALLPGGPAITYDHDPVGRRIAKRVNGAITEKYLWQGSTRLLAVYDGSNTLILRFTYADERMPLAMTYSGATYYLLYDQIGSLRAVSDASGSIVKRIDYDVYGSIIIDTNPGLSLPLGFAGGLFDKDTELVRFGARDYDPALGRWNAKDPIDFAGGDTNLYGYIQNDPITRIDPLGLWYIDINVSGGFILGGTGGVMINNNGIYPYIGGGLTTPGGGGSITWSPSDPSTGWNIGLQGQAGIAGQVGYSFNDGSGFWEVGGGWPPGVSLNGYYVFGPFLGPKPQQPLQPAKCY